MKALMYAFNSIISVSLLTVIFYFICGIIGINYFKGMFYDCELFKDVKLGPEAKTKWDCVNYGGLWKNSFLNFNNIKEAMSTFFIISSTVQWGEIMYRASRVQGIDMIPSKNAIVSPIAALFFILVVVICNFFLMNLFIGVIITKYNR
jgi:hypothetical protein